MFVLHPKDTRCTSVTVLVPIIETISHNLSRCFGREFQTISGLTTYEMHVLPIRLKALDYYKQLEVGLLIFTNILRRISVSLHGFLETEV